MNDDQNLKFKDGITKLVKNLNSFKYIDGDTNRSLLKFIVNGKKCGIIFPKVASVLQNYPDIFIVDDKTNNTYYETKKRVTIHLNYQTTDEITVAVGKVIEDLRLKKIFPELDRWRYEEYNVKERFSDETILFRIERSASSLFGVNTYGCHINGYVKKEGKYYMWIARRSKTKQTFPGMLDNFTAGGLTANLSLLECAKKEMAEEAGVSEELESKIKMVDAIAYAYLSNYCVNPEAEFIFDIKLPVDFKPVNQDGEVDEFYLMSIDQLKKSLIEDIWKPNSAAVTLTFLMRKGLVTPIDLPNYLEILDNLHSSGL